MYICLGNGGDATGADQSGVLVLGDDGSVAVTGASAALQEVITIKMADMSDPALAAALFPPTMWIQLTGLRIVGGGVGTTAIAMTPSYYVIDSGTSGMYLEQKAFAAFDAAFCAAILGGGRADTWMCEPYDANSDAATSGYLIASNTFYSGVQLDAMLPNISFTFKTGSAPVNFLPSTYMIYIGISYGTPVYAVPIMSAGDGGSVLGNYWMTDWLIKQTPATLQLTLTRVASCSDVTYGGNPSTAYPSPTPKPSPKTPPKPSPPSPKSSTQPPTTKKSPPIPPAPRPPKPLSSKPPPTPKPLPPKPSPSPKASSPLPPPRPRPRPPSPPRPRPPGQGR